MDAASDLVAVALLAEPIRQRLYAYVRDRHEPVGREDAATHAGITVKLAAFHLDKMADAGLLDVEFRRLSGRVGPGAGRPAKLYSISPRSFSVVIPPTRYALAASMMATALSGGYSGSDGAAALQDVAATVGEQLGEDVRAQARTRGARREAVTRKLAQLGYEPRAQDSGELTLRNCIFSELSASHRDLVCGMNVALVRGLVSGAHLRSINVEKRPTDGSCCVRLTGR
ncbi:MAG TPA: transcriptional regulator [Micromonosporaceae bacterium]|nr:transcriptional regulator [Micromonosporaceae bacterium]